MHGIVARPAHSARAGHPDNHQTFERLIDACRNVMRAAESADDVTVRQIAAAAGVNPSAISYHFGSQEWLIVATAQRVYRRFNAERLALLLAAVARMAPAPPAVEDVIAALLGPSIRWSLDPASDYRVLSHLTTLAQHSRTPELYQGIVEDVGAHRAFIPPLRRIAPWLTEADIGWRLSCALGIRSQAIRQRHRTEVLTARGLDLSDPDAVLRAMIDVITPMFRRPG